METEAMAPCNMPLAKNVTGVPTIHCDAWDSLMLFMVFAHAMKAIDGSWLSVSIDILMA